MQPLPRLFSRTFDLDARTRREHNEDIMPNNFDPAIGKGTQWRKGGPSPNPGGRPRSRLLSSALGAKLAEIKPGDRESRTYAEVVAANLIGVACSQGHSAVTAAADIANRLEGRATQRLDMNDISADLAQRSDAELRFYLVHECWPNDDEMSGSVGLANKTEE